MFKRADRQIALIKRKALVTALFAALFAMPLFGWQVVHASLWDKLSETITKQANEDVIVLSSDRSIRKYAEAEKGFTHQLTTSPKIYNLKKESNAVGNVVRDEPSLIYAIGSNAFASVQKNVGGDTNVVFSSVINWKRFPLHKNIYGIAAEVPIGYQLTMFRYIFPKVKKIGVLYSKKYNQH